MCQDFSDRKGTPKNFCDKDFAELSGKLSVAIYLKTLVLIGSALELFRKFFGALRAIFWLWGSVFAPEGCLICSTVEASASTGSSTDKEQ